MQERRTARAGACQWATSNIASSTVATASAERLASLRHDGEAAGEAFAQAIPGGRGKPAGVSGVRCDSTCVFVEGTPSMQV